MAVLYKWIGGVGPDWSSGTVDGTAEVTNWQNTADKTRTAVPSSGDDVAFATGGTISVGGGGDADSLNIFENTTVVLTNGRFNMGATFGSSAPSAFDLAIDDGCKLIIQSGAGMQNTGSVSIVGIGLQTGTATMEVDPGGLFTASALIVGDSSGDAGFVAVNGALEFVIAGSTNPDIYHTSIGNGGTGSLDVTNTQVFFTERTVVGEQEGAVGALSVDRSTWGGGDVTVGAAGTGHVTIGAGATVALGKFVVGLSAGASGDLTVTGYNDFSADSLTVGAAGTGTAAFLADSFATLGTVAVGVSAGVTATMTLDGAGWRTSGLTIGFFGTGEVTAGAGEVVTVYDTGELGVGPDASGVLTVDDALLNGGTLVIGEGGTGDLEIGSGSSGTVSAAVLGADAGSSGMLTLDGADWTLGSLTVGQGGEGRATVETGATATVGSVVIGPSGTLAVTEAAGAAGSVVATQISIEFGTLDLTGLGRVLVGAATGVNGAAAIGGGASLSGLGELRGNVTLSGGGQVLATGPLPGALRIDGGITGLGTIQPLVTLEANGAIGAGVTIGFQPSSGVQVGDLLLDVPGGEKGTITGFSAGNTIDVMGMAFTDAVFTQGTSGEAGTLTLTGGGLAPLSLAVMGDYAADSFHAMPGTIDTVVTLVPCFAAGTRIATTRGEVAVEALRVGDMARTADGGLRPVVWIGHRRIDCARHPAPGRVWPVRVRAHAFGPGRPARALRLSPDHAVLVENVLIPIRCLIDGEAVAQERVGEVVYYHVELDAHDVMLAEGLPAESFLDTGGRVHFANGGAAVRLHADFAAGAAAQWEARGCAKLTVAGPAVERARRGLAARAAAARGRFAIVANNLACFPAAEDSARKAGGDA